MAAPPKPDPLIGTTLGRYTIEARLGAGGMGAVYRAKEGGMLGRTVALKVLPSRLAGEGEFIERFVREAQRAAGLRHGNVVQIYDADEADGNYFIAMQLMDGGSLADLISRHGALDPSVAARVVRDTARGLACAHKAGIVHRDIKPANIFLDDNGARLGDFGLVKALDGDDQPLTQTGMILGTPHYMAPEQCEGATDVDHRADLYALGLVLYHALSGKIPAKGSTPLQIIRYRCMEDPEPLDRVRPGIPPALVALVGEMLERDRDARLGDAAELARRLDLFLGEVSGEGPTLAVPASGLATTQGDAVTGSHAGRTGAETVDLPQPGSGVSPSTGLGSSPPAPPPPPPPPSHAKPGTAATHPSDPDSAKTTATPPPGSVTAPGATAGPSTPPPATPGATTVAQPPTPAPGSASAATVAGASAVARPPSSQVRKPGGKGKVLLYTCLALFLGVVVLPVGCLLVVAALDPDILEPPPPPDPDAPSQDLDELMEFVELLGGRAHVRVEIAGDRYQGYADVRGGDDGSTYTVHLGPFDEDFGLVGATLHVAYVAPQGAFRVQRAWFSGDDLEGAPDLEFYGSQLQRNPSALEASGVWNLDDYPAVTLRVANDPPAEVEEHDPPTSRRVVDPNPAEVWERVDDSVLVHPGGIGAFLRRASQEGNLVVEFGKHRYGANGYVEVIGHNEALVRVEGLPSQRFPNLSSFELRIRLSEEEPLQVAYPCRIRTVRDGYELMNQELDGLEPYSPDDAYQPGLMITLPACELADAVDGHFVVFVRESGGGKGGKGGK